MKAYGNCFKFNESFDFKKPDYLSAIQDRAKRLKALQSDEYLLKCAKAYYKENIAEFINDFGWTVDPRNINRGLPAKMPFILFPKQVEFVNFVIKCWKENKGGLAEKSRDMGLSWLTIAIACSLCIFYNDMSIGFGSRKKEYVDKHGFPRSLFYKARLFVAEIPKCFRGEWEAKRNSADMKISFPLTNSSMTGESGDNIGRGDRQAIYFVDEAAFLEHPELVDSALSATTNCRIDISSVNGMANPFAQRRHSGMVDVFSFHWRDDPRKDDAWYKRQTEIFSPITVAQEIDMNYRASVEGLLIPSEWVQSAIDAHKVLGVKITGTKFGSLDVADQGADLNAFACRHGILLQSVEAWSGKGGDMLHTTQKAFDLCDGNEIDGFDYDADGLGAGIAGFARVVNEQRQKQNRTLLRVEGFKGSGKVINPTRNIPSIIASQMRDKSERRNEDYFANFKAQAWWDLRVRFQRTHIAVSEGKLGAINEESIISIDSTMPKLEAVILELAQPTYSITSTGKLIVDKTPDGTRSPNLADSVMMLYAPKKAGFIYF